MVQTFKGIDCRFIIIRVFNELFTLVTVQVGISCTCHLHMHSIHSIGDRLLLPRPNLVWFVCLSIGGKEHASRKSELGGSVRFWETNLSKGGLRTRRNEEDMSWGN